MTAHFVSRSRSGGTLGDQLYVPVVNGPQGAWFRGTQARQLGQIRARGVTKDVAFVSVDPADQVGNDIDAAYRAKYRRYPASIVNTVLTPQARAATLELRDRRLDDSAEEEGTAQRMAAAPSAGAAGSAESSPWAPLAHRAFRWLWFGVLLSYLGTWMQTSALNGCW